MRVRVPSPAQVRTYLNLIAFTHTIFALPFVLWTYSVASQEKDAFELKKLVGILLAVVSARTAAMAFNRYVDRHYDAQNPRTQNREIPQGILPANHALAVTLLSSIIFILSTLLLNNLCLYLSPVALLVLLGYSYAKRFTPYSHLWLGAALGLAPVGTYVAMQGSFSGWSILLGLSVLFWVAGFDILYALQDQTFDRQVGLHSIPARFGEETARQISYGLHLLSIGILGTVSLLLKHTALVGIGWTVFSLFILRQHQVAQDLQAIPRAFFTHNGYASLIFGFLGIADVLIGRS
ncbi:MAG: UbiA-like polyprenyltransferase [Bacteroidia bacterium]